MKKKLPEILEREITQASRLFEVERLSLRFSNGNERIYERIMSRHAGAVLIVPKIDENTLLLIREYCGGTHRYELGFPKGVIDQGESVLEAANRELKEEVGYGARDLNIIKKMTAVPGYWGSSITAVLAQDLYPQSLEGDEPEPLELVPWKINDYENLLARDDFTEARSIAALLMIKHFL